MISVKVPEPEFEGQTKNRLGNPEVRGIVDHVLQEELVKVFEWHPKVSFACPWIGRSALGPGGGLAVGGFAVGVPPGRWGVALSLSSDASWSYLPLSCLFFIHLPPILPFFLMFFHFSSISSIFCPFSHFPHFPHFFHMLFSFSFVLFVIPSFHPFFSPFDALFNTLSLPFDFSSSVPSLFSFSFAFDSLPFLFSIFLSLLLSFSSFFLAPPPLFFQYIYFPPPLFPLF